METKNIIAKLRKLGFTEREAEIYLMLLQLGESPVGQLIDRTGLHRELVYGALRKLESRGLVRSIEKRRIRHYVAEEPEFLMKKIKENAQLAEELLPELKLLYKKLPVMVRIYEGPDGYEEIQKDIQNSLQDGDGYFVIGAAGSSWYEITKPFYKKYRKLSLKRRIHAKMVTFTNEVSSILDYEYPGFAELRVLPQRFAVPSSTKIYADKIILQILGERPLAVMIQSEAVSKAYKRYFETLWGIARPLENL